MTLPQKFKEINISRLGESEAELFFAALESPSPVSIRYNPLKGGDRAAHPLRLRDVEWCSSAIYLESRPQFTLDPTFHGGVYYVQEASSTLLECYITQAVKEQGSEIRILDMCAAPGGKSTHISALIPEGVVVANETIKARARILAENVTKWGIGNVIVTSSDSASFRELTGVFDVVVVDAPCSGEGMFRKDVNSRGEWSPESVALCSARSRRILANAYHSLKEGGMLIYSTCTFNREEDEETLEWLTENYEVENVEISLPEECGVTKSTTCGIDGYKCYPHKVAGEGFFISAVRKCEGERSIFNSKPPKPAYEALAKRELEGARQWIIGGEEYDMMKAFDSIYAIKSRDTELLNRLYRGVNIVYFGVDVGEFFKGKLKPAHALALFTHLNREMIPTVEVSLEDAQEYLRKGVIDHTQFEEGINLVSYNSTPIGFIKRISNRCNNLYPKEYRIYNL